MISVAEAHQRIATQITMGPVVERPLAEVVGGVLARALSARVDIPAFDNSAMDGFALRHTEIIAATREAPIHLPLAGQQLAGAITCATLPAGHCVRIATGARVPDGATAVIPLEEVTEAAGIIAVTACVAEGACIRRRGEEIRRGDAALPAGTRLTPATLGFLAGIGYGTLPVARAPIVDILATGSELLRPDEPWREGHIYESNSIALASALREWGIIPRVAPPIPDDPARLRAALATALRDTDFLLVTGGCSVGSADYLKELLAECDVEPIFWQVRQKPGKPLYFGRRGTQCIFGLPGNPVSSLVCYYEYVRTAIQRWFGDPHVGLPTITARIAQAIEKTDGKTHFLRAQITTGPDGAHATPIGRQESHRMGPFAQANGLIVIPAGLTHVAMGSVVEVHLLPDTQIGAVE